MWRSLRTTNTKHDMIVLATPNRSRFERKRKLREGGEESGEERETTPWRPG